MCDPLRYRGKTLLEIKNQANQAQNIIKHNRILFVGVMIIILASMVRIWNTQPVFYAHAYVPQASHTLESPLFASEPNLFDVAQDDSRVAQSNEMVIKKITLSQPDANDEAHDLEAKIYDLVGEAPIREMVPMIAQRDERVAAFLVGIAKKESSFGQASPSKNGQTCYNYWGYKGEGSRGVGMGYACFGSPQEAVETVGNRIQDLVNKDRTSPAKMVDTWKCGRSCSGDPNAQSWISAVALYFNKIVG